MLAVKYTEWRYLFSATQLAVLIAARCYYAYPDRRTMEELAMQGAPWACSIEPEARNPEKRTRKTTTTEKIA